MKRRLIIATNTKKDQQAVLIAKDSEAARAILRVKCPDWVPEDVVVLDYPETAVIVSEWRTSKS